MVCIGGVISLIRRIRRIGQMASLVSRLPIGTIAPARFPSPGEGGWEGTGEGPGVRVRGRVKTPPGRPRGTAPALHLQVFDGCRFTGRRPRPSSSGGGGGRR